MTISSITSRVSYPGAGSTGPFAFPFRIFADADLLVTLRDANGAESTLTLDTDYTVSGAGNATGSITLDTALAVGETLVIRRDPSLVQPTSVQNSGSYFAKTHEDEFDRLIMQMQASRDRIDRAFKLLETLGPAGYSLELTPETGKLLGWISSTELGNVEVTDPTGVVLPAEGRSVASLTAYLANNAVHNVKDYGAVGDGATDDRAAINLAIAACTAAVAAGKTPLLWFPPAVGYAISAGITLPLQTNVQMDAPVVYTGGGNVTAVTVGAFTSANTIFNRSYKLWVERSTVSTWLSEASIGIKLGLLNTCFVEIVRASGFTIGVQTFGDDSGGFVHNVVKLGLISNNKYGVDLNGQNLGTSNENLWLGGQFTVFGPAGKAGIARYGVSFRYTGGTYHHDNNLFIKPSFEMNYPDSTPAVAQAILCERGTSNEFIGIRDEGNNDNIATFANDSVNNRIDVGYGSGGISADTSSAPVTNVLQRRQDSGLREFGATLFSSGPMHKRAAYADGATSVNIPGVSLGVAGDASVNSALNSISITRRYVEASRGIGVFVDTTILKKFVVSRDVEVGYGGRVYIVCYDANDQVITTAGSALGIPNSPLTYSAGIYGNSFGTGSDAENDVVFQVTTAVKKIRVLVSYGTNPLRIRSFTIRAIGTGTAAVWTGIPLADQFPGVNLGTATPTLGTFEVGHQLLHTNVPSGGNIGRVCTTAGTAGTLNGGATTGGITTGTPNLVVNSATGLEIGQYITIAGVAGVKKIINLVGTAVTIDSNANATVAGAAVAFSAVVFKTWGVVA